MYELKGKPKSTKCIIDGCEREKLPGISYCRKCRARLASERKKRIPELGIENRKLLDQNWSPVDERDAEIAK